MSSNFPIGNVSSARESGAVGIVAAGHETNALDVIASARSEPSQISPGWIEFDLAYVAISPGDVHASLTGVAFARVSIPSPLPGVSGEVEYRLSGPEFTEHLPEVLEAIPEGTMPDVPGAMRGSGLVANGLGRIRITEDLSSGVQTVDIGLATPTRGGNSVFGGLRTSGEYGFGVVASITVKGTPPAVLPAALTSNVTFGHSWELQVLSDFGGYGEYVTGIYDWSALYERGTIGSPQTPSYFDELIIKSGLMGVVHPNLTLPRDVTHDPSFGLDFAALKQEAASSTNDSYDRDSDPISARGTDTSNSPSKGHNKFGGYDHHGSGTTTGKFAPSAGQWEGGNGRQSHGTPRPDRPVDPDYEGVSPILLDLDGTGVRLTELSESTQYIDSGNSGLKHKTAWAGAGDGVLFFHPDGRDAITETRQYVFTEWDPGAESDLEALRSAFASNGDGKLTIADAEFAKFKILVTKADGTTEVKTLAQLNITEIDLTGDATHIELPDGSLITGQTSFTRGDGTTGIVADATLVSEDMGYRVEETTRTDGSGNTIREMKAYAAFGRIEQITSPRLWANVKMMG